MLMLKPKVGDKTGRACAWFQAIACHAKHLAAHPWRKNAKEIAVSMLFFMWRAKAVEATKQHHLFWAPLNLCRGVLWLLTKHALYP
jgi:hypothetical protein